ncbi:MAG TPA: hypothetical protein VGM06_08190 [Polyangiaceae bacterium]|jgi:hypothetical protein
MRFASLPLVLCAVSGCRGFALMVGSEIDSGAPGKDGGGAATVEAEAGASSQAEAGSGKLDASTADASSPTEAGSGDDAGAGATVSCTTLDAGPGNPQLLWVAFDANWCGNGRRGIYLVQGDGTGLRGISDSNGDETQPAFSPDGTELAYTSNATGVPQIYLRNFATAAVRQLTTLPNGAQRAAWSRDGSWIAFLATPAMYQGDGGPMSASLFPDEGTADAYLSAPDGTGLRDVVGEWQPGASSGYPWAFPSTVTFGADPNVLIFTRAEQVSAIGFDGTGLREIAGTPTLGTENASVSPDGSRVAFASYDTFGESIFTTSYTAETLEPGSDGVSSLIAEGSTVNGFRNPAWGPTNVIAFEVVDVAAGTANIAIIPAAGGATPLRLTSGDARNPMWAPSGFTPPY